MQCVVSILQSHGDIVIANELVLAELADCSKRKAGRVRQLGQYLLICPGFPHLLHVLVDGVWPPPLEIRFGFVLPFVSDLFLEGVFAIALASFIRALTFRGW